jgi:hypothetical protein
MGMNMNMNILGKDLEKARQRREVPSSLKKIVSLVLLLLAYDMLLNVLLELDTEYRYWSFMEAHAHNSLPAKAKMEAMDVLTWAWTGNCVWNFLDP